METDFLTSCGSGYINVAKWAYNLSKIRGNKIDIHIEDEYAFVNACSNGHKDIAQWLYNIDTKINININNNLAFRYACSNGHFDLAQWLYNTSIKNKDKISINMDNNIIFRIVCLEGLKNMAEWLYNLSKNNIDGNTEINIQICIEYLNSLHGNYMHINIMSGNCFKVETFQKHNYTSGTYYQIDPRDAIEFIYELRNKNHVIYGDPDCIVIKMK